MSYLKQKEIAKVWGISLIIGLKDKAQFFSWLDKKFLEKDEMANSFVEFLFLKSKDIKDLIAHLNEINGQFDEQKVSRVIVGLLCQGYKNKEIILKEVSAFLYRLSNEISSENSMHTFMNTIDDKFGMLGHGIFDVEQLEREISDFLNKYADMENVDYFKE